MEKYVVLSSGGKLDTSQSVVREDCSEYPNVLLLAEGVAVFNKQMELLPLISDFLTDYRKKYSDQSVRTYASNLCYLVNYLVTHDENHIGSSRDSCLLNVHATEIQSYFSYCRSDVDKNGTEKQPIKGTTLSNRDATYRRFFSDFLCNPPSGYQLMREENPYEYGSLVVGAKESLIKPALFLDVEALILVANHEREKCLVQFMFDSGIRRGEVENVLQESILQISRESRKSVILDDETFQVSGEYVAFEIKGNKGRGREAKYRTTVISKETIDRVQKYNSSIEYKKLKRKWQGKSAPAFLNQAGNAYSAKAVSKLITKLYKRALKFGIIKRSISPHKIRHGFGAMLLKSEDLGKTELDRLLLLQHCLGHDSLDTTQKYTKIPIGVWDKFVDRNGNELKRHQLMKKLKDRTRVKKGSLK